MDFEKLGVMIDCSRNAVLTPASFRRMVEILSKLGYNTIRLYTEDTYEVDGEPYFGYLRGRYSKEELREMDAFAASHGMELVPCIQTLAHLNAIFRYEEYDRIRDTDDILLVGAERTYELIEHIFATLAQCFTSRRVNIGMDEAYMLGKGKYLRQNGLVKSEQIMHQHLDRVLAIAAKYGFTCEMWGDMFIHAAYGENENEFDRSAEVKKSVPDNVTLVCWDYYHTDKESFLNKIGKYQKLSDHVGFAGGAWTWLGFCPNNDYSMKEEEAVVRACREKGIKEVYFTMWGDNGAECSPFGVLPALVCGAEFARGNFDMSSIKKKFREIVHEDFDLFCALDLPDKIYSEETDRNDPSKVLLYTDVFAGIYDTCVKENTAKKYYESLSARLKEGEKGEWGYLFRSIRTLSDVLAIKFELGVKTRKIYRTGDKAAIAALANGEYTELQARLEAFYEAFEQCWMTEKKPHGFDVQDARLGGVIRRIAHCKKRLLAYANGEVKNIPELEEEILNPFGWKEKPKGIMYNLHRMLYTVNVT